MTDQADLLIVGAPVWTGDPARPWADAVAVRDLIRHSVRDDGTARVMSWRVEREGRTAYFSVSSDRNWVSSSRRRNCVSGFPLMLSNATV